MELFKKILWVLLGALLTMSIILLVNTMRLGNTQIEPGTLQQAEWDRELMAERFSRALQFKTISGDDGAVMDSSEFRAFLDFLQESFPLVHSSMEIQTFNEFTNLYYWEGSDASLDPILLMGHYDVVPIDSTDIDGWNYPPFSGEIADGYIWGRGTLDNKNNVMGLLETAEYLLTEGFQPARSIYFTFGHDEEIGGHDGARSVARYFQDQDISLYFVLDEGGAVVEGADFLDRPVASVGIAEKGYLSLELIARSRGGHSSAPPGELAIIMLSDALVKLHENQFPSRIDGAVEHMFDSVANIMPFGLRILYGNRWLFDGLLRNGLSSDPSLAPMVRTTTAPTILRAGVKDNVLPNEARAVVNFRLLPGDTFEMVKEHVTEVIANDNISIREYGTVQVPASRVSPVRSSAYEAIQQAIMDHFQDVYVTPYLVSGATDSRYFTTITENVYRFSPIRLNIDDMSIIHGTNERINKESYLDSIHFYSHLIRKTTE